MKTQRFFLHWFTRWSGITALIGTLLGFVGAYYSVQLYKNLRTDFRELLPTSARSVVDLREVTERLESIDNLAILVLSKHPEESRRFVDDLTARLQKLPKSLVSSVEYRIDRELNFFKRRQALFMELPDLVRIRNYIRDRIDYEKALYNPLTIFSEQYIPEPKLDFLALKQKYDAKTSVYSRFPGGYYATPDQTKRAVLVYVPGGGGIDLSHKLRDTVDEIIRELNPSSYAPDLEIKFTGGVQDGLEEHAALIADLELSTIVVAVIVTVAMLLFYRSIRATIALSLALFIGTFWTFGASYFLVGYLNANSAFLGSIVLGNGINFGIIFMARYFEERRTGKDNARTLAFTVPQTATATWTAAGAAGLAYGSLMLTSFRGFNQFGVIGLVGMVLCWIATYTVLPAYLTIFERFGSLAPPNSRVRKEPKSYLMNGIAAMIDRIPRLVWGVSLAAALLSVAMISRYDSSILETNLAKLRNKESLEHGSAFNSKIQDEIFGYYLSPLVILPKNRDNAQNIAKVLKEQKEKEGSESLIKSVQTLEDFMPKQQLEKIAVLKDIKRLLPPKIFYRLAPADQLRANELLSPESMKPIHEKDLPGLLKAKFTERDGSIGKLVLVEPPLDTTNWSGDQLTGFIDELRAAADRIEPGAAVAGTLPITGDMIKAISYDGPKATLFALIAVVLLVVVLFRNVKTIALILSALFLGMLWLAGLIMGFDFKINFLNFIALPITFGIGVDYGVNIFQRYREEGGKNILKVLRNTGSAVALCSFTTIVGYASLLIASNQGFVSFGALAVAGELTCLVAALISIPAYLQLRQRKLEAKAALGSSTGAQVELSFVGEPRQEDEQRASSRTETPLSPS